MPVFFNGNRDDPLVWDKCSTFAGGMVSFAKASGLQEGQNALLYDTTIHITGQARKRRGFADLKVPTGPIVSGFPVQAIKWYDTATNDRLLAVVNGSIYSYDQSLKTWSSYISAAVSDTNEMVSICQLSDDIWWTDSSKGGIRKWKWDTGVISTVPSSPAATILMSASLRLVAAGIPTAPNSLWFSDYLNANSWPTLQSIGIGEDGDPITCIKKWQKYFIIVAKYQSVYMVDANPQYGAVISYPVLEIHASIGCVAKKSMCQLGQDMFFLSKNGVMKVTPQEATDTNVLVPLPVSQAIQDVVQNIRWAFAYRSVAVSYNNHYILSVPVNSNFPDTVIVYSNVTGSWAGIWRNLNITDLCEQPYLGTTRLVAGDTSGRIIEFRDYLAENQEQAVDYTDLGTDIQSIVRTRAMTFGDDISMKTPFYLECEFYSRDGTVEVYAMLDGKEPILLEDGVFSMQTGTYLPATLPFQLAPARWVRKKFPLFNLGQFRDITIEVRGTKGNLILRSLTLSAQMDSINIDERMEYI